MAKKHLPTLNDLSSWKVASVVVDLPTLKVRWVGNPCGVDVTGTHVETRKLSPFFVLMMLTSWEGCYVLFFFNKFSDCGVLLEKTSGKRMVKGRFVVCTVRCTKLDGGQSNAIALALRPYIHLLKVVLH